MRALAALLSLLLLGTPVRAAADQDWRVHTRVYIVELAALALDGDLSRENQPAIDARRQALVDLAIHQQWERPAYRIAFIGIERSLSEGVGDRLTADELQARLAARLEQIDLAALRDRVDPRALAAVVQRAITRHGNLLESAMRQAMLNYSSLPDWRHGLDFVLIGKQFGSAPAPGSLRPVPTCDLSLRKAKSEQEIRVELYDPTGQPSAELVTVLRELFAGVDGRALDRAAPLHDRAAGVELDGLSPACPEIEHAALEPAEPPAEPTLQVVIRPGAPAPMLPQPHPPREAPPPPPVVTVAPPVIAVPREPAREPPAPEVVVGPAFILRTPQGTAVPKPPPPLPEQLTALESSEQQVARVAPPRPRPLRTDPDVPPYLTVQLLWQSPLVDLELVLLDGRGAPVGDVELAAASVDERVERAVSVRVADGQALAAGPLRAEVGITRIAPEACGTIVAAAFVASFEADATRQRRIVRFEQPCTADGQPTRERRSLVMER